MLLVFYYLSAFNCVLLAIEFFFCLMRLPKRRFFWLRAVCTAPLYLVFCNTLVLNSMMSFNWLFAFVCLGIFGLSLLLLHFWFDASWISILFYGSAGYAVENIIHYIRYSDRYFGIGPEGGLLPSILRLLVSLLVIGLIYYFIIRTYPYGSDVEVDHRFVVTFVLLTLVVTNLLNSWMKISSVRNGVYASYAITCDLLLLMVQFGVFHRTKLTYENEAIRMLMEQQAQQQKAKQESIDLINVKCHDLKHQIAALRAITSPAERNREIEELEKAVTFYDSVSKTGNSALDTILTDRKLVCDGRQIPFTYMVDAAGLERISTMDIYTLFGNALDNAIEASSRVTRPELRMISMKVERQGNMTRIAVENYCEEPVQMKDGLPVTTKGDTMFHGFGLKSIRMVVNKYHGNMIIRQKDQLFCLYILIP